MRARKPGGSLDRTSVTAALVAVAIASVAVVLLFPYGGREEPGLSYDTPYYVWRTRVVATDGPGVLTTIPTGAVPERPGVPVLGAMLGAVTGTDALTYVVIVRALAAIAIGLAAGAMAVEALGQPRWAFAAFVVGLGASAAVVGTAVGSFDQLLVDVVLVATAAVAPLVASGRRGVAAAAVLLAAAAAIHWVFAALFLVLLAGVIVAFLPASLAARRSESPWSATPPARLLRIVLVASAAIAAALVLLPALPGSSPSRGRRTGEPPPAGRLRASPPPPARRFGVRPHDPAIRALATGDPRAPRALGGERPRRPRDLRRHPDADQALPRRSVRARHPRPRDARAGGYRDLDGLAPRTGRGGGGRPRARGRADVGERVAGRLVRRGGGCLDRGADDPGADRRPIPRGGSPGRPARDLRDGRQSPAPRPGRAIGGSVRRDRGHVGLRRPARRPGARGPRRRSRPTPTHGSRARNGGPRRGRTHLVSSVAIRS